MRMRRNALKITSFAWMRYGLDYKKETRDEDEWNDKKKNGAD